MSNDLREEVSQMRSEIEFLRQEVSRLSRELQAQGIEVPDAIRSANPAKLSPQSLRKLKQQLAARARAAKPVGPGKGRVSSSQVKRKLEKEARKGLKKSE